MVAGIWGVADVEPFGAGFGVALQDELVVWGVAVQPDEPAVDGEVGGPKEVGGLAFEVLTGGAAAYGTVQLGGAVAGVDYDGLGEGLTQGLEDVETERLQVGDDELVLWTGGV